MAGTTGARSDIHTQPQNVLDTIRKHFEVKGT